MNYQHLFYFYTVVKSGGLSRAAERLRLRPHSVSAQLKAFQEAQGCALLERSGRNLVLTAAGARAMSYAEEIFRLGEGLQAELEGRGPGRPRLRVGLAEAFPKLVGVLLLRPLLELKEPAALLCEEDRTEALLARLALGELDAVLSDAPAPPTVRVKAYNHLLGESMLSALAPPALAARLRRGFPLSLGGSPAYLPAEGTALRRNLEAWAAGRQLALNPLAEFTDSALMKAFAGEGGGWVPVPRIAEADACSRYGLKLVGRLPEVKESFYAITVERRVAQPALQALLENGRRALEG